MADHYRLRDLQLVHHPHHVGGDALDAHGIAGVRRAAGAICVDCYAAVVRETWNNGIVVVLGGSEAVDED